jgi:hypothetical protein
MTKNKRKGQKGIPDWTKKRNVIKALLSEFTDKKMVTAVVGDDYQDVDVLIDAQRKWHKHWPMSQVQFWNTLATRLNCEPSVKGVALANASIIDFIGMLPAADRQAAREAAGVSETTITTAATSAVTMTDAGGPSSTENIFFLCYKKVPQSISAGVEDGMVDTRHYYSTPDAAETWRNLVSTDSYSQYEECEAGLRKLTEHSSWQEALRLASPTTAVMLAGGGGPTKDIILLKCLLEQSTTSKLPITMLLVDVNFHMLAQTRAILNRAKTKLNGHERASLQYACADVLELDEFVADPPPAFARNGRFQRNGRSVFAITGGTIGNLSEYKFFQSIQKIATLGDLLIVSADTVDELPQEDLEKRLRTKYDNPEMQQMILPGVIAVLKQFQLHETVQAALKRVEVRVLSSTTSTLSDVPDSWNVTSVLKAKDREITLLNSTRYSAPSFAAFAMKFGWELVCTVPSPLNQHYLQFAFRRK